MDMSAQEMYLNGFYIRKTYEHHNSQAQIATEVLLVSSSPASDRLHDHTKNILGWEVIKNSDHQLNRNQLYQLCQIVSTIGNF